MTPDQLVTLTKQHIGNRTGVSDTWVLDRVNSAYRRLATWQGQVMRPGRKQPQNRVLRFYELEDYRDKVVGPGGSNFVAHAITTFSLLSLYDVTNGRKVRRTSRRSIEYRDPTDAGSALLWAPGGQGGLAGYYIYKTPVVATTLREYLYKYPETLVAAGAAPVIPEQWHDCIHMGAGAEAAGLLEMTDIEVKLEQMLTRTIAGRRTPHEEARSTGGSRYVFVGAKSRR